mmetsp:Transcript_10859/g.37632  ORF Transcript_10859/g.37632 Transcript_10859/m.37632 type:complete len:212 (+) Transcript_10859:1254-1889(+)
MVKRVLLEEPACQRLALDEVEGLERVRDADNAGDLSLETLEPFQRADAEAAVAAEVWPRWHEALLRGACDARVAGFRFAVRRIVGPAEVFGRLGVELFVRPSRKFRRQVVKKHADEHVNRVRRQHRRRRPGADDDDARVARLRRLVRQHVEEEEAGDEVKRALAQHDALLEDEDASARGEHAAGADDKMVEDLAADHGPDAERRLRDEQRD